MFFVPIAVLVSLIVITSVGIFLDSKYDIARYDLVSLLIILSGISSIFGCFWAVMFFGKDFLPVLWLAGIISGLIMIFIQILDVIYSYKRKKRKK